MARMTSDEELRHILQNEKRIAVIGLSPIAARPSYGVTRYMIAHGYEIYGVRPASPAEILGRPCVESLNDLKSDVDILDVFRNPEALPGLMVEVEAWFKTKPRAAWPKTLCSRRGSPMPKPKRGRRN